MRELHRAAIQFACEATIYAAEHILESLLAQRPMHDEPLPAGYTPGPIDDFTGFSFGDDITPLIEQHRNDIHEIAKQTRTPNWDYR